MLKVAQLVDRVMILIQIVLYNSLSEDVKGYYYNLSVLKIEGGEFIVTCLNLFIRL